MLSFPVVLFLAFSYSKLVICNDEGLDVIVQRYKALGYSEISEIKNQRYKFRFCVCDGESTSPESDSRCACSRSEDAELVQKSIPHALYSSSCIHSPKQGKCLVGSIISSPRKKDLYMKLSIDDAILTDPPYQKTPLSRFKSNARLTCAKEPCSESCLPCKSGFIEISYVVISKAGSSEVKALSEAADFRKLHESPILQKPPLGIRKFDSSQIKAYKKLFSDLPQQKISSFTTIEKIKDYLLAKSAQFAIAPSTFNAKSYRQNISTVRALLNLEKNRMNKLKWTGAPKLPPSNQIAIRRAINKISELYDRRIPQYMSECGKQRKQMIKFRGDWLSQSLKSPVELLKYHNIYRSRHGAPPLTNSDQLQHSAQQWAQQLANSASCLKHDPVKRYGESLFFYAAKEFPDEATLAEATVQSFYIEAPSYDYHAFKPLDYYKTGHFTQLIWKSTKNLGIGVAIRRFDGHRTNNCQPNFDSNLFYVVVKYDPPGNIQSSQYYLENVSPARY